MSFSSGNVGGSEDLGVLNSRISAPPEKALAEPMMTSAFTAGSAAALFIPSMMPGRSTLPRPLTGGLFGDDDGDAVANGIGCCVAHGYSLVRRLGFDALKSG